MRNAILDAYQRGGGRGWAGMITGVFMLPPIAIYYFARVFDASLFSWYHYVIAVVWFVFVFWLSFRSPIYWGLGKKPDYEFTEQSAFGMYGKG